MRHRRKGRKLNRSRDQRKALFKNLVNALILHGRIETTEAKAKAVKGLVDRVIHKAQRGTLPVRRLLTGMLGNQAAVRKVMDEIAPGYKRVSGFTRVVRLHRRRGDAAQMVRIELVEADKQDQTAQEKKSAAGKKAAKAKVAKSPKSGRRTRSPAGAGTKKGSGPKKVRKGRKSKDSRQEEDEEKKK
jgi:large subunit ribosomal protein L17